MTRTDPRDRQAIRANRHMMQQGESRLLTGTVCGLGNEGMAILVQKANWNEPFHNDDHRTIVKLRQFLPGNSLLIRTTMREIAQGLVAGALHLPFVTRTTHWWQWDGSVLPTPMRHHVMQYLGPAARYDITDLLNADQASSARRRILSREAPTSMPIGGESWDDVYLRHRRAGLARRIPPPAPLIVIEQPNAGEDTLFHLLREKRVLETRPANWIFFRGELTTIARMVSILQRDFGWIHGDMSLNNVMTREHLLSSRKQLPHDMERVNAQRADLALAPFFYTPSFIDLSRSAVRPDLSRGEFAACNPRRVPTFEKDALDYVDSFRRPGSPELHFSRTADMRRIGLSLAFLIAAAVAAPPSSRDHISLASIDVRMVRVARTLLDLPAAWLDPAVLQLVNRAHRSQTNTARSRTCDGFVTCVLWLCDYLERIERLALRIGTEEDAAHIAVWKSPTDPGRSSERYNLFLAVEKVVSADLNSYLAWTLALVSTIEDDDVRRPELVAQWDILAADA